MTQPLALVVYEKLLPGTQLVNRLQDLGYRVQGVNDPSALPETAEAAGPIIVFADLESAKYNVLDFVRRLRSAPATGHVPVVAFAKEYTEQMQQNARASGVTLLTSEAALTTHLPELLQQALQVE